MIMRILLLLLSMLPGYVLKIFLEKYGLIRRLQSHIWYFVFYSFLAIISAFVFPKVKLLNFVIIILLISIFGENRFELWHSFRRGRWWWLDEE